MSLIEKEYALEKAENQYYLNVINEQTKNEIIRFIKNLPSAKPERCSDCIAHGGDWECDHIHCRKGRLPSAQINCIVNNDIHLCDSCKYSYPSCPRSKFDVVFGDSVGHDNICACNKYQPRYDEEWRKLHYESSYSQGFLEGVRMCEQAQPDIVTCKECVYYFDDFFHCNRVTWDNEKDDFCSKGKRKTDGGRD